MKNTNDSKDIEFRRLAQEMNRRYKHYASLRTAKQRKVIQGYGESILGELAYGIRDKCRTPFAKDGSLTKEGAEAARDIILMT